MVDETISLAEARAIKNNDSSMWTPADCLRSVLKEIDDGKINPVNILILFEGDLENDNSQLMRRASQLTKAEESLLLMVAAHSLAEECTNE